MKKLVLAGAVALAMAGTSLLAIAPAGAQQLASVGAGVAESHISHLKSVLNLTAEQQAHWPAVESALRQVRDPKFDALGIKRVLSAARPLIRSLDENQKRTAMRLAHSMGFASVAAAAF
jgi:hypothetical protein